MQRPETSASRSVCGDPEQVYRAVAVEVSEAAGGGPGRTVGGSLCSVIASPQAGRQERFQIPGCCRLGPRPGCHQRHTHLGGTRQRCLPEFDHCGWKRRPSCRRPGCGPIAESVAVQICSGRPRAGDTFPPFPPRADEILARLSQAAAVVAAADEPEQVFDAVAVRVGRHQSVSRLPGWTSSPVPAETCTPDRIADGILPEIRTTICGQPSSPAGHHCGGTTYSGRSVSALTVAAPPQRSAVAAGQRVDIQVEMLPHNVAAKTSHTPSPSTSGPARKWFHLRVHRLQPAFPSRLPVRPSTISSSPQDEGSRRGNIRRSVGNQQLGPSVALQIRDDGPTGQATRSFPEQAKTPGSFATKHTPLDQRHDAQPLRGEPLGPAQLACAVLPVARTLAAVSVYIRRDRRQARTKPAIDRRAPGFPVCGANVKTCWPAMIARTDSPAGPPMRPTETRPPPLDSTLRSDRCHSPPVTPHMSPSFDQPPSRPCIPVGSGP